MTKGAVTPDADVRVPSDMYAIGDAFFGGAGWLIPDIFPVRQRNGWTSFLRDVQSRGSHGGQANVAFCDGHVESPKVKAMYTAPTDAERRRWNRDHEPHPEHWR